MKKYSYTLKIVVFDLLFIEFGPLVFFVIAYYLKGFSVAALTLAVATVLSLIVSLLINKRIPWFAATTGILTATMSAFSYLHNDPDILILTDSCYYFALSFTFAASTIFGKLVLKKLFGHIFSLTDIGWKMLEFRAFILFSVAGVTNELVRAYLSLDHWIIYKQIAVSSILIFGLLQLRITCRYRTDNTNRLGLCTFLPSNEKTKVVE